MKKISVDIKNGMFTVYPTGEVLTSLVGYINKSYFKKVGESIQLKVVLVNEDKEYTLNCMTNNVTYQSLVTELINRNENKVNLNLIKEKNEHTTYYLIKNQ